MPIKCAVNGFGRIGRLVFRYAWDDPSLEIVHVNDLCSCESASYLVQYDSVHGTWHHKVDQVDDNTFTVDDKTVTFSQEKDFTKVDWAAMGVDMVMECTGKFLKVKTLEPYFTECGVKRVVVSAPVKEPEALNVVLGCNHGLLKEEQKLVTNASCTTNCLAPVVKVVKENFGIKHGCITTVHDVTGTQTVSSSTAVVVLYVSCVLLVLRLFRPDETYTCRMLLVVSIIVSFSLNFLHIMCSFFCKSCNCIVSTH